MTGGCAACAVSPGSTRSGAEPAPGTGVDSVLSRLQIAENVWDPVKKRSRVRILHNCGRSDDPEATERLRRLARSILKRCSPEELVAAAPSLPSHVEISVFGSSPLNRGGNVPMMKLRRILTR